MSALSLTANQLHAMIWTERICSIISAVSLLFIMATFMFSPLFNKPINRLIFYASFGNAGLLIAALISQSGPLAGLGTPLCQFQGFIVQMFLGVDAVWATSAAFNVYLIFFHGYTAKQIRALDWRYLFGCYGIAFVPAFVYIFIDSPTRGRIYGPSAVLWCWVTVKWDFLRVVTLYGVVWLFMILAITIYIMAARVIYAQRHELQGFLNPFNENPFANTVTIEVTVTHEDRPREDNENPISPLPSTSSPGKERSESNAGLGFDPYSVNVAADKMPRPPSRRPSMPSLMNMRKLSRAAAEQGPNTDAWLYARVAFLFFLALLVTWVPSSINRIYSLIYPERINFGLNYASALVFPLQGFWNCVVYIITSQTACKDLWATLTRDKNKSFQHRARASRQWHGQRMVGQPGGLAGVAKGEDPGDVEMGKGIVRQLTGRDRRSVSKGMGIGMDLKDDDVTSVTSLARN